MVPKGGRAGRSSRAAFPSSLSDLGSIYAGEVNSAAHLAVKSSSRRLAAINGTGSKDMRSPQSRLEWCAGSAQLRLSAYIRLMFQAMVTRFHSPRTQSSPRSRN